VSHLFVSRPAQIKGSIRGHGEGWMSALSPSHSAIQPAKAESEAFSMWHSTKPASLEQMDEKSG
jgi:hypothetical protein